ncbi:MAG: hypothetical protein KC561_04805 [Myxococcales bacterium]|nr:hypothetical protein [Myxococcales bacterium]
MPEQSKRNTAAAWFLAVLALACLSLPVLGCRGSGSVQAQPVESSSAGASAPIPEGTGANSPYHDAYCEPEVHDGFVSEFACEFDSDCLSCACEPINREEYVRVGEEYCERFNQPPAREECVATNAACCGGHCVLAR